MRIMRSLSVAMAAAIALSRGNARCSALGGSPFEGTAVTTARKLGGSTCSKDNARDPLKVRNHPNGWVSFALDDVVVRYVPKVFRRPTRQKTGGWCGTKCQLDHTCKQRVSPWRKRGAIRSKCRASTGKRAPQNIHCFTASMLAG